MTPSLRHKIEQLLVAVIFLLIFPLLPLVAEYFRTNDIKEDSLTLCLAFYAFTLSVSTKYKSNFATSLLLGIIESFRYKGTGNLSGIPFYNSLEFYIFILLFSMHFIERITRHLGKSEIFFNFE
jgi:hypothetical protein